MFTIPGCGTWCYDPVDMVVFGSRLDFMLSEVMMTVFGQRLEFMMSEVFFNLIDSVIFSALTISKT